jgi:hypothetical protein
MVTIIFPDRDTEKRALAFLLGRFSGLSIPSSQTSVPSLGGIVPGPKGMPRPLSVLLIIAAHI